MRLMSHQHNGNCGHEHDHDHDHDQPGTAGPQDNLFQHIDRSNVLALNATGDGSAIIKPWNERLDETVVCICLLARSVYTYHIAVY